MADVLSVVAKLKLTSKGKLQYGQDLQNEVLTANLSKLCISSHTSTNFEKVTNNELITCEYAPEKYKNYFTTKNEKEVDDTGLVSKKDKQDIIKIKESKPEQNSPDIRNETDNNFQKSLDKTIINLRNIEEEYREQGKHLRQRRLYEYYMNVQEFDLEYIKSIEAIEKGFIQKQNQEVKQLDEDQNRTSEELACYQAIKEEREFVASEKLRLAELHRKEIEIKIQKNHALKEEKNEEEENSSEYG